MPSPVPGNPLPRVGVITVSYGSEDVLAPFLASVPSAYSGESVVVVADNLPQADSSVANVARDADAIYLPMSSNLGYGQAMNAAAGALPADVSWILISNPDVLLTPGTIDTLIAVGKAHDLVGSVGPAIHNADGTIYPSARGVPSLRTGVGHAMFANLWTGNPWTRAYRNDSAGENVLRDAGWLSGACVLVRRSVFDQLGGFDPAYFMYFEDVDLGYRIGKLGYRNVYQPLGHVQHFGAHSTEGESSRMVRAHHDSAKRFLAKKYPGPLLWPIRAVLTVGLDLRSRWITRKLGG